MRFLTLSFFRQTIPSRPLIHTLKYYFCFEFAEKSMNMCLSSAMLHRHALIKYRYCTVPVCHQLQCHSVADLGPGSGAFLSRGSGILTQDTFF
jgi:hypothetical protein